MLLVSALMFSSFCVFGPFVQVRKVTALLSRPVTASWESLGLGNTSILSSITLPEKQEAEDKMEENEVNNQDKAEGKSETSSDKMRADSMGIYHTII